MDRFLISPLNTGLETDLKPWQTPDDSFSELVNAYVFRGRVRKRWGSVFTGNADGASAYLAQYFSRLSVPLGVSAALTGGSGVGTTDNTGAATGTKTGGVVGSGFSIGNEFFLITALGTPTVLQSQGGSSTTHTYNTSTGAYVFAAAAHNTQIYYYSGAFLQTDGSGNATTRVPGSQFNIGQQFVVGSEVFTVTTLGTYPTPGALVATGTGTGTFDTTLGLVVISSPENINTQVYYYPSTPVMGIGQYIIGSQLNYPTIIFDTQFAYKFLSGFWQRIGYLTSPIWHGSDSNFFNTSTWNALDPNTQVYTIAYFITNFNASVPTPAPTDDPMWWYNNTNFFIFKPYFAPAGGAVNTGPFIQTAQFIIPFKNRLVLLNTIEQKSGVNTQYVNRARYSWNGSPLAPAAFYEPNQQDTSNNIGSGGGFSDAPTLESIVSYGFVKDRLIVYFERSTYELVFTNNQYAPFLWQKINTELGSEGPQSSVDFDKVVLTMGSTGVHACNGANVIRVDDKIPDEIFNISDKSVGTYRVAGIRDYQTELVYFSYPIVGQPDDQPYPTQILVYNYKNGSWAKIIDNITAFGYFQQPQDLTWENATFTWEDAGAQTWSSGLTQSKQRQIIFGTPEGFILQLNHDQARNAPSASITAIAVNAPYLTLTIINHSLTDQDYIIIETALGTDLGYLDGLITKVQQAVDQNTITINIPAGYTGTYLGGGTIARVSNLEITSKQWNPYVKDGRNFQLAKIDFCVEKTATGQVTVANYPSASSVDLNQGGIDSGCNLGISVLETSPYDPTYYPLEQTQERLWHPLYFQADGEFVQISIYMSDAQMTNNAISLSDFELEGLTLYCQPTTSRME